MHMYIVYAHFLDIFFATYVSLIHYHTIYVVALF